jgi:hypothetical protein
MTPESRPDSTLDAARWARNASSVTGVRNVLACLMLTVLSASAAGCGGAGGAAKCSKYGPAAIRLLDLGLKRHLKLGAVYGVPLGGGSASWAFAARIPGAGVAAWSGDLTPTASNNPDAPLPPRVGADNAVAWENSTALWGATGSAKSNTGWFVVMRAVSRRAVACFDSRATAGG